MKKATFEIVTISEKTYRWKFEECEIDPNDYGNKHYIKYITPSKDEFLLDCRYATNYNFIKLCVEFLINYYGENLDELYEVDEEKEPTWCGATKSEWTELYESASSDEENNA